MKLSPLQPQYIKIISPPNGAVEILDVSFITQQQVALI